jgi:hypothetical protein
MIKSVAALAVAFVFASPTFGGHLFSKYATSISDLAAQPAGLPSPNGLKTIHARKLDSPDRGGWPVEAWVSYGGKDHSIRFGSEVNAEVIWSPDSSRFAVTYSDTGAVGWYHVVVYLLGAKEVHILEPIRDSSRLFKTYCNPEQAPNAGAVRWSEDSRSLFVALEVPPHSSCASMGTFQLFEIEIPGGKPLRIYHQHEAKKLFADSLGAELRNADDECVELKKSCIPPSVHLDVRRKNPQR